MGQGIARSWRLTSGGQFWRVLGIRLLTGIIVGTAAQILAFPLGIIGGVGIVASGDPGNAYVFQAVISGVSGLITGALTTPFTAGVDALLYVDQRIRREGFDVQLIAAAQADATRQWPGAAAAAMTILIAPFDGPPLDPSSPEAQQWVRRRAGQRSVRRPSPRCGSGSSSGCWTCSPAAPGPGLLPPWAVVLVVAVVLAVVALVVVRLVRPEPSPDVAARAGAAVDEEGLSAADYRGRARAGDGSRRLGRRTARQLPRAGRLGRGAHPADRPARTHRPRGRCRAGAGLPPHADALASDRVRVRRRPLRPPQHHRGAGQGDHRARCRTRWRRKPELGQLVGP